MKLHHIAAVLLAVGLTFSGCHQEELTGESQPESSSVSSVNSTSQPIPEQEIPVETVVGTVHLGETEGQFLLETESETLLFAMGSLDPTLILEGAQAEITYTGAVVSISALPVIHTVKTYLQTEEPPMWAEYMPKAEKLLHEMSLEQKVGQMFFLRCPETSGLALELIESCQPGGFVLFGRDFAEKTAEQVKDTIASYQKASEIPMLISADEEGGTVVRVSANPLLRDTPFRSPGTIYQNEGMEGLIADTREKSRLLLSLGVNVNFAPVCDFSKNPADYIYSRTIGQDLETTCGAISAIVGTMCAEQLGSSLKHFPGYGGNVDTHTGIAHDERPYEQFLAEDFRPFLAGIEAGAGSVMVSHNIVACMDEEYPASISPKVHRILREELDFAGVILTDDLVMDGIRQYLDSNSAAVQAVLAGNDMLLVSDYSQIPAVLEAVRNGILTEELIDTAVTRVLCWKLSLGLIKEE